MIKLLVVKNLKKLNTMAKEKDIKAKNDKKAPTKSLKEKRAEKAAKRAAQK